MRLTIVSDCIDVAFHEMVTEAVNVAEHLGAPTFRVMPLVPVQPFKIQNTNFLLALVTRLHRPGSKSVYLAFASGVAEQSMRVAGRTVDGIYFVGNNNGSFAWMASEHPVEELVRLPREDAYASFGGRNSFAPTCGRILAGAPLGDLGEQLPASAIQEFPRQHGEVLHIDNFDVAKTYQHFEVLPQDGQHFEVAVNGLNRCIATFHRRMKFLATGTYSVLVGSSLDGLVEFGRVREPCCGPLGIAIGDVVTLRAAQSPVYQWDVTVR